MSYSPNQSLPDHDALFAAAMVALAAQYPGRFALSPGEALLVLPGPQPEHPDEAARQRRSEGSYPFRTRRIGGRLMVLLTDVAEALLSAPVALDGTVAAENPVPRRHARTRAGQVEAKRRPGRPRKTASASVEGGAA